MDCERHDELIPEFVDKMLLDCFTSAEIHQATTMAVLWIEQHPNATEYVREETA